jgi:phosphonate transport system substrate-binding protein
MPYQFTVSPDFSARVLPHWSVFNTRLQRFIGEGVRLEPFESFGLLHEAISADRVDLIYANAADTARLVREKGFVPLVAPARLADEATVVVPAASGVAAVSDFRPGVRVAATEAPDVSMICRMLLEPADLQPGDLFVSVRKSYVLVAKALLSGEADAGFFLAESFDQLAAMTREQLRPVIRSRISVVRHSLLAGPRVTASHREALLAALLEMTANPSDKRLLEDLGLGEGWAPMTHEDAEFLIDLMCALG